MIITAGLNPNIKGVGIIFGSACLFVAGIFTQIFFPATLVFLLMGIIVITQVETTYVMLQNTTLRNRTFGRTRQEVDIDNIKDIVNFKYHNCYFDLRNSRIYSFDVITRDDNVVRFKTGCIKGCELIQIMNIVYYAVFDKPFDIMKCENSLAHLVKPMVVTA